MRYLKIIFLLTGLLLSSKHINGQACIQLSALSGPENQKVCKGSPIINIIYVLGPGVTATVLGLPAGVTGTPGIQQFIISGSPSVAGKFDYEVNTTGTCTGTPKATGTIEVIDTPLPPTGNTTQSFCSINIPTIADLTATGTGIRWYSVPTGGAALPPATLLVNGYYYASQTVDGCESISRLAVFATVNDPPSPSGPSPQVFCQVNNPTIATIVVSGSGIKWYLEPIGGASVPSSTALVSGTYYSTQTIGSCESDTRFRVDVTVNNPAAPTGSTTQNFCTADNPTVANLTATGSIIKWYLQASGGSSLPSTATLSTNTYYASQTVGGCESALRLAVSVTVSNPPAPTGISPQNFCLINSPKVADLVATGTGIKWYLTATGGAALPSTTALTSTTYYASQTYGTCESTSRLAVVVTISNPLAPTGTSPQNFCSIANPTVADLIAAGTAVKWYLSAAGGIPLATTASLANNTYYASQTVNGCESNLRLPVVVTISNPPAPLATSPQIYCAIANPTVASLAATGIGIKWYLTPTGGAALGTTTALVTGTFYASQTVAGCESASRTAVAVTVNDTSAPTGISPQIFCSVNNPVVGSLVASGSGIRWYLTPTGGTALPTTTPLTNNTFYASQTTGTCESAIRLAVNVTVNDPAPPTGVTPQVFCSGTNPTVSVLTATGTGIQWYLTASGGTALTPATPLSTGVYYASQTVGGCESLSRLAITVTVNQTPVANAGAGGDACGLAFALHATAPVPGTGTWTQTSGPGTSVFSPSANAPNATVTVSVYGTYTFTWTVVNNNCSSASVITINFFQQPVANAGTGGIECDLDFVLTAVPSVGVGTWTIVTGTGAAVYTPTANTPGATVTVSASGIYTFRWTETNGTCISSSDVTVNFNRQPLANAGPGGDACSLNFALNAVPSVGLGTWSMTGGTGTATFTPNSNSASATVSVSEYGTKEFTWIEVNGPCSGTSKITVNFYPQPVANAGSGGNNCGLDFNLIAIPSVGVGTWTIESGPGSATFGPNANSPRANVSVSDYGVYVFRWTELIGTCTSSATVTVTFIQQPQADGGNGGDECDLNFALNAVPGQVVGMWSKISGPGNAVFSPNANQFNATVTVSQYGSYDFAWTEVNSLCNSSDIIRVTFHDRPQINAGADLLLCKGRSIQLNATGTGTFLWSPANHLTNPNIFNPVASPDVTTAYTVTLTDRWGCVNSDQVNVEVRVQPVANAGPDQILEFVFETHFGASPLGTNQTGLWTIVAGKGDISDVHSATSLVRNLSLQTNSFLWTVTNGVCPESSDTVHINVKNLNIPTLITPNDDGYNDLFVIRGLETIGKTSLTVFNRWGARVFETDNYENTWKGVDDKENLLPDDTYFYILKSQQGRTFKGYVVIRR